MQNPRYRIHDRIEQLQGLIRRAPCLHLLGDVGVGRDETAIAHRLTAQQHDGAIRRLDLQHHGLAGLEARAHLLGQGPCLRWWEAALRAPRCCATSVTALALVHAAGRQAEDLDEAVVPGDQAELAVDQADAVGHVVEGRAQHAGLVAEGGLAQGQLAVALLEVAKQALQRAPGVLEAAAERAELVLAPPAERLVEPAGRQLLRLADQPPDRRQHLEADQREDQQQAERHLEQRGEHGLPALARRLGTQWRCGHLDPHRADPAAIAQHGPLERDRVLAVRIGLCRFQRLGEDRRRDARRR